MRVVIRALRFSGSAALTCRRCSNKVQLPDDANVIIWDDGHQMMVRDPLDGSVRHRCGRSLEWHCPACGAIAEPPKRLPKPRSKATSIDLTCPRCVFGRLMQREVEPANVLAV